MSAYRERPLSAPAPAASDVGVVNVPSPSPTAVQEESCHARRFPFLPNFYRCACNDLFQTAGHR